MQLPVFQPHATRSAADRGWRAAALDGVSPQGGGLKCIFKCAAALAACAASSNPVECLLATAPDCVDCL